MAHRESANRIARRQQALDLRISGMRYRQIGEALGVSHAMAFKDVQSALDEIAHLNNEKAARLREIELVRCERLTNALEPGVQRGDERAVRAYVAVMDRRAKLLGLDAPTKLGVSGDGEGGPVTVVHQYLP